MSGLTYCSTAASSCVFELLMIRRLVFLGISDTDEFAGLEQEDLEVVWCGRILSSFGLWTAPLVLHSFAILSPSSRPLGLLVFRGLKELDELKESILWSNNGS